MRDEHEPDDIYDVWVEQKPVNKTPPCKMHPNAPHGFDMNASNNADRYVCECEGWEPQPEPPPECQTEEEKTAFAFGWWKAMETKRQWVGLTDEEIKDIREDLTYDDEDFNELEFARDIEAKLKEKNGG